MVNQYYMVTIMGKKKKEIFLVSRPPTEEEDMDLLKQYARKRALKSEIGNPRILIEKIDQKKLNQLRRMGLGN